MMSIITYKYRKKVMELMLMLINSFKKFFRTVLKFFYIFSIQIEAIFAS